MVKIEIRYKGPYRVIGEVELVDPDGQVIPTEDEVWLCRCGHSGNAPFCDGTHKRTRASDDDKKYPPSRSKPS
jgi:CDGSH-type Zn-finger protein